MRYLGRGLDAVLVQRVGEIVVGVAEVYFAYAEEPWIVRRCVAGNLGVKLARRYQRGGLLRLLGRRDADVIPALVVVARLADPVVRQLVYALVRVHRYEYAVVPVRHRRYVPGDRG